MLAPVPQRLHANEFHTPPSVLAAAAERVRLTLSYLGQRLSAPK
jgi:hypothetical protein